jgi:hypothetical protein
VATTPRSPRPLVPSEPAWPTDDKITILADVQPVPPTGGMFEPVETEGLMVTPYANDKGRMAFSFRPTAGFARVWFGR